MTLYDLAKIILLLEKEPITKVRFAKTIYFVHKELINRGFCSVTEIQYVRMPLGPVPSGFMTLTVEYPDIISKAFSTGLPYNSTVYSTPPNKKRLLFNRKPNPLEKVIGEILDTLRSVTTSSLIEISHRDPSWISNSNGYTYTISEADLKNPLPQKGIHTRSGDDNQLIQASLVRGMIDDIVSESTDLEYPDENTGF